MLLQTAVFAGVAMVGGCRGGAQTDIVERNCAIKRTRSTPYKTIYRIISSSFASIGQKTKR